MGLVGSDMRVWRELGCVHHQCLMRKVGVWHDMTQDTHLVGFLIVPLYSLVILLSIWTYNFCYVVPGGRHGIAEL
jgi:hypothetical protein